MSNNLLDRNALLLRPIFIVSPIGKPAHEIATDKAECYKSRFKKNWLGFGREPVNDTGDKQTNDAADDCLWHEEKLQQLHSILH